MGTALFWVITRRVVVIPYRRFGTSYRPHLQGSSIQKYTFGFLTTEDPQDPLEFLSPEDGTDTLYRNVGNKLPLLAS